MAKKKKNAVSSKSPGIPTQKTGPLKKRQAAPPPRSSLRNPDLRPAEAGRLCVRGVVTTSDAAPAAGLIVVAYDKDTGGENRLGEAITDATGSFCIEYGDAAFRRSKSERGGADVFVRVYRARDVLLIQSKIKFNAPADYRLDVKLTADSFVVRGRVAGAGKGQKVVAFDKDLRDEESLGEALTDSKGNYAIRYGRHQFKRAEKASADLRVVAVGPKGEEYASSEIIFNAADDQVVDLDVSGRTKGLSEYERYLSDLKPVLAEVALLDLDDKDIAFLAGETGISNDRIAWLVQAAKLSTQAASLKPGLQVAMPSYQKGKGKIPTPVFYGWFRLGLPTRWEALQRQRINVLRTALVDAIKQDIIPANIEKLIEEVLLLVPNREQAELISILGSSGLPPSKMKVVLEKVDGLDGVSEEVLDAWVETKTLAESEAELLGLTVSLHRLAGGDPQVVSAVLQSEFSSIRNGRLQKARDLVALDAGEWESVLEQAGSPVPPGATRAQQARAFVKDAAGAFPHAAFVQRTKRVPNAIEDKVRAIQPLLVSNENALTVDFDALDLSEVSESQRGQVKDAHASLKRFANLHPGLGLDEVLTGNDTDPVSRAKVVSERVGWLSTFYELNPEVGFIGLDYLPDSADLTDLKFGSLPEEARERVLADLKAQQRIYSIAGNPVPAVEIMEAGFHSASAIALTRASNFATMTGLPEAEALAYHAIAQDRANAAALQWFNLHEIARDKATTPVRVIPSQDQFFQPLKGFAELSSNQPWCECEHCQSVLSPAAYFVDLMYYIEENVLKDSFRNGQKKHPLHLQVRRPDLWELELTCKNTNDYVPYLDVVNEVLERYLREVLPLPSGTALYQHLADQAATFRQPFTFPLERLEILLEHFGLSRYEVVKAMGASRASQVRAQLKLSKKEYDLITTPRLAAQAADLAFFSGLFKINVPAGMALDALLAPPEVQTLLQATGLSHDAVEAVLESKFVNTDGSTNAAVEIVRGKRTSTDVQNNSELVKGLTLRRLDRVHRLVRLWRKLPWTVEELDYAIGRLSRPAPVAEINAAALEGILDLWEVNAAWSLSVEELLALSDSFPSKGLREATPLFDRLFNQQPFRDRDGAWPAGLPLLFSHPAWTKKANSPSGISGPSNNTLLRLLAGFQIADKELVELIANLRAVPALGYQSATATRDESISLSQESLGILYRHARLHALLKTKIGDTLSLIALTPRIAARPPSERFIRDLEDLKSVVDFCGWQKSCGFTADELIYVTGGVIPTGAANALDLAAAIVEDVQREKSLEFADTVFTQIGLTDLQSRQIVLANTGQNARAFELLVDGSSYRLRDEFDPAATPLVTVHASIQPPVSPPIDPAVIRALVENYHPLHVLDVALGGALGLSPKATRLLRKLAHPLDSAGAIAIGRALQTGDSASLRVLIGDTLRLRALFKNKVFGEQGLTFVRDNRVLFFAQAGNSSNPVVTIQTVRNVAAYVALASAADLGFKTASAPADLSALHAVLGGPSPISEENYAKTLRTDKARISALKPHLGSLPTNPFNALELLRRSLVLAEQLGVSGETLSLMKADGFDDLSRAAEDVFGAFRAKYPEEKTFQEKLEPFGDKLRTRKRDGLVDFIVSAWPEPFADANRLYDYFLLDVMMQGCARTSRVVAAISSLQLYVHRVLMTLEKSADLVLIGDTVVKGAIARFTEPGKRGEWYWRQHYRVWEANRKVFLYPENYIEPELRDDKTPLFKEFEDSLLQQEVTDASVHDAYAKYLTGLDEAARLKIAGTYYDSRADLLHLFGVTQDSPPIYYYRTIGKTLSNTPRLSAWQKLTVQIPVSKVSPVLFEERLYVFWLETTTRPVSTFVQGSSEFEGYRHNVRLKYSTLRLDGAWTPPQALRFSNGGALEEFRVIRDPRNKDQAALDRAARIQELEETVIPGLKSAAGTAATAAKDADDVWKVALSKSAAATRLADNPGLWVSEPLDSTRTLGDVTLWIIGNKFLTGGWDKFGENWLKRNPGWVAAMAFGLPPHLVTALMAKDAMILIEAGARAAASQAEADRLGAVEKVTAAETELSQLKGMAAPAITVRWDKSGRDHTEPVDNYKPEGWAWERVYPDIYTPANAAEDKSIRLVLAPGNAPILATTSDEVDLTSASLAPAPATSASGGAVSPRLIYAQGQIFETTVPAPSPAGTPTWQNFYRTSRFLNSPAAGSRVALAPTNAEVQIVNGYFDSLIVEAKGQPVWMRKLTNAYLGTRLGTTLTTRLRKQFGQDGAKTLLNAEFQDSLEELPLTISPVAGQSDPVLRNPFHATNPFLTYFREAFFQIPFLVANHLNSQRKFAETQRWYHTIFNPTAEDGKAWRYREFRNLPPVTESLRALLTNEAALTAYREDPFNPHAIARTRLSAYQKSIVMKYVDNLLDWGDSLFGQFTMESINEATMLYVMAQDILGPRPATLGSCGEGEVSPKTYAAIRPGLNKVSDFLVELEVPVSSPTGSLRQRVAEEGKRLIALNTGLQYASTMAAPSTPAVGPTPRWSMTAGLSVGQPASAGAGEGPAGNGYQTGTPYFGNGRYQAGGGYQTGGKFWTNVDGTSLNKLYGTSSGNGRGPTILGTDSGTPAISGNRTGNIDFINPNQGSGGGKFGLPEGGEIKAFDQIPPVEIKYGRRDYFEIENPAGLIVPSSDITPVTISPIEMVPPKQAVFCIPPNKDLLAYWGRVEDRLYKIRNCMDIAGARRRPELFSPEIDPRFLVRMKSLGLTLDDVLNATSGNLPPYRFSYLIEKAKQHASALQSFGAQLLSAIEKRDGEELAQLRAVHEQNLLTMRSRMVQMEIDAAEDALEGLRRQKTASEYRRDYFYSLSEAGLLASESKQQELQHEAANFRTQAGLAQVIASILTVIPDIGAPTAMKFGGSQIGAAGRAVAEGLNALAAYNEMGSAMAGREASNRRRDQDWKHQVQLAKGELLQIEKQISAAEIRRDIAVHTLEVHEKTIAQSEEIFEHLGLKFSNFGRYTLLSTRLHGLYRQAFDSALSFARMTEQAYRAERSDDEAPLGGNYWDATNAGLLAGERLMVDLQNLELQYIEKNYRQLEVEQSFSLAQFAPKELASLRMGGECAFTVPEWFFDLTYPGQYRRRLKAVRLTIPCVTGPYTNVGASLRLENSRIRVFNEAQRQYVLETVPLRHTVGIAASKAQYDAGVFDFNFRDERYMPFEGAGAFSTWELSLPKTLRAFDYATISDVILHLSYTADFDPVLKTAQESEVDGVLARLKTDGAVKRVFSLRQDFPDVFYRLITSPLDTEVGFKIDQRHLPFFLLNRALKANALTVRFISPLASLEDSACAVGVGKPTEVTAFKEVKAPQPPANEVRGPGLSAFDLETQAGSTELGIANLLIGDHVIKLTNAGPLAPDTPVAGGGAIDPGKLNDILLEVAYRIR